MAASHRSFNHLRLLLSAALDVPSKARTALKRTVAPSFQRAAIEGLLPVEAPPRWADVVPRSDWLMSDVIPQTRHLATDLRLRLADAWQQAGQVEHASVATTTRFALDLLSLGAPPDLLSATYEAARDETLHARLSFQLASCYLGEHVGPASLAIDAPRENNGIETIVTTAIYEGCVGETIAALEAQDAASAAEDPVIVDVLERIAEDEMRHAALAWKFLRWVATEHPPLRPVIEATFTSAMSRPRGGGAEDDESLLIHGVLGPARRASLRKHALTEVVAPCARSMIWLPTTETTAFASWERAPEGTLLV